MLVSRGYYFREELDTLVEPENWLSSVYLSVLTEEDYEMQAFKSVPKKCCQSGDIACYSFICW